MIIVVPFLPFEDFNRSIMSSQKHSKTSPLPVKLWVRFLYYFFGIGVSPAVRCQQSYPGNRFQHVRYDLFPRGRQRFSGYMSSDPGFAIGRDFVHAKAYVLLFLIWKVSKFWKKVQEIDARAEQRYPYSVTTFQENVEDWEGHQRELAEVIEELYEALRRLCM